VAYALAGLNHCSGLQRAWVLASCQAPAGRAGAGNQGLRTAQASVGEGEAGATPTSPSFTSAEGSAAEEEEEGGARPNPTMALILTVAPCCAAAFFLLSSGGHRARSAVTRSDRLPANRCVAWSCGATPPQAFRREQADAAGPGHGVWHTQGLQHRVRVCHSTERRA